MTTPGEPQSAASTSGGAPTAASGGDARGRTGRKPAGARAGRGGSRLVGGTAHGLRRAGRGVGSGLRRGGRRVIGFTRSKGAGESGLAHLVYLQFAAAAGDAAVAVSLAGTLFFAIPTAQARPQVAQFLLLTMAPFAVVAPFIGPFLDRIRHGRRWAIGTTVAVRAFLCWALADSIAGSDAWLYPCALGCLVASKAFTVTRAAAVPRLLPESFTLVNANSRISLAGVAGAAVSGGLAAVAARLGVSWSLRWAFRRLRRRDGARHRPAAADRLDRRRARRRGSPRARGQG